MPRPVQSPLPAAVPWKAVALPVEHGGWGFLLEPAALGLLLAPSVAGLLLALAALCAFLARHPLRLVLMDRRRRTRYPRTVLAERFLLAYLVGALLLLLLALALARSRFWPALVPAAVPALLALWYDARGKSRDAAAEAIGAVALAASAAVIALAGGAPAGAAGGAAALMALRAVASVVYVRARIRLDRGVAAGPRTALGAHLAALLAVAALVGAGWAPRLAIAGFLALLARAGWGLSRWRKPVPPRLLGLSEMRHGLLVLALVALGYRLGL